MKTSTKIKLGAVVAAAAAVAGGGVAIAATDPWDPKQEAQAVIDDAAQQLGVEPDELSDALKQALKNRVDDAVVDGRLTEEQGAKLKKAIDSNDLPLPLGLFGMRSFHLGPKLFGFGGVGPFANVSIAADYLGLSQSELSSRLADGKSFAEIARAEGKSVDGLVDALVAPGEEKIDAAVDAGTLSKFEADDAKSDLRERTRDLVNGEFRFRHKFEWRGGPFDFRGFDGRRFGDRGLHRPPWFRAGPSA